MAELSAVTGIPPATIKWYLREGLLAKGQATARNQSQYGEEHVRRLRLIRALVDIGGLSTARARSVLEMIDDPQATMEQVMGGAHGALSDSANAPIVPDLATSYVDDFIAHRNWAVQPDSPARADLAATIRALISVSAADVPSGEQDQVFAGLDPYADAMEHLAAAEVASLPVGAPREVLIEQMVIGTVLVEKLIGALRRLAQEHSFLAVSSPREP